MQAININHQEQLCINVLFKESLRTVPYLLTILIYISEVKSSLLHRITFTTLSIRLLVF